MVGVGGTDGRRVSAAKARYGRWAVVAGASEGLGAAFASELAARGHDLVLIARRADALAELARELRETHRVEVVTLAVDLGSAAFPDALASAIEGREVGVAVYNAAHSFVAPFLERPVTDALQTVEVNVRAPLRFVHALAPAMVARRRGAIVLMSSLAGFTGSPKLQTYAASKAFLTIFAEGLWAELAPHGVEVIASCAGAIRTPNYEKMRGDGPEAPGTLDAEEVVRTTLAALGSGPTVVPGSVNKLATFFLRRLAPRTSAIAIMGRSVEDE